jgi:hypothetical protein
LIDAFQIGESRTLSHLETRTQRQRWARLFVNDTEYCYPYFALVLCHMFAHHLHKPLQLVLWVTQDRVTRPGAESSWCLTSASTQVHAYAVSLH